MKFFYLVAATLIAGSLSLFITRALDWPYWSYFAVCCALGLVTYVVSVLVMGSYVERRAPEFANRDEILPGIQSWELTAGTGVVPKWVSYIGILSVGFFLAIPFELLASLFR